MIRDLPKLKQPENRELITNKSAPGIYNLFIYRVNRNFLENLLNDYSSKPIQYYPILRPFLDSKIVGKCLNC